MSNTNCTHSNADLVPEGFVINSDKQVAALLKRREGAVAMYRANLQQNTALAELIRADEKLLLALGFEIKKPFREERYQ